MKSPDRRSMGMTCSVCPWSGGFSLCQELMRRSSESFRHPLILWRTLPAYQGLQRKSCWLPVWVYTVIGLHLNKTISQVLTLLQSIFFICECLCFFYFCQDSANLPEGASTPALGLSNKAVFQGKTWALQFYCCHVSSDNHFSFKNQFLSTLFLQTAVPNWVHSFFQCFYLFYVI